MKRMPSLFLIVALVLLASVTLVSAQGQEKIAVCHWGGSTYIRIKIADPAWPAHHEHGDHIAGGDVLDENCEAVITDRYIDNDDGTVTDTQTGLVWLRAASCFFGPKNRYDAARLVDALGHGQCFLSDNSSPGDWRLPTEEEWDATTADAVALGCTRFGDNDPPSLTNTEGTGCFADEEKQLFWAVQADFYWSSTAYMAFWFLPPVFSIVHLGSGNHSYATSGDHNYVWPVRGGQ